MVNFRKLSYRLHVKITTSLSSVQAGDNKRFGKLNLLRFNKTAKCLVAVAIIAVILISAFAVLSNQGGSASPNNLQPTATLTDSPSPSASATNAATANAHPTQATAPSPFTIPHGLAPSYFVKPPGIITSAPNVDKSVWMQVAQNAWSYFSIRTGVDENTGLPYAGGANFGSFTDWDLGVYIQATMDAQKLGLVPVNGQWGSYGRIDKVLTFLETRELQNSTYYPYWFYDARTAKMDPVSSSGVTSIDLVDTGRLFVALNNLRNFTPLTDYNSTLTQRINNIVLGTPSNRTNYSALVPDIWASNQNANSIYTYYVISGFASFFPQQLSRLPGIILDNLGKTPKVNVSYQGIPLNVSLPKVTTTSEPLYCTLFELNNDTRILSYARDLYLAHEAYYNISGSYAAFSEGDSDSGFIYEWVIGPNGGFWEVTNAQQTQYYNINPIIYSKIAFCFLALYNTTCAKNTCMYLEDSLPDPSSGYGEGADYNIDPTMINTVSQVGSNTNGLILEAALYGYQHYP